MDSPEVSPNPSPSGGIKAPMIIVILAIGAVIGGAGMEYWTAKNAATTAGAQTAAKPATGEVAADIARLKTVVPSQSHTMADVGYHWAGLWFAAEKKNWPLAQFFFDEARQHIRWTVAIRPVRKGPDGQDVDIKGIFDGIDVSVLATVKLAIESKDSAEFTTAYKQGLEACYSCHKAVGRPYLRPQIPTTPPLSIINFDPKATWPE